MNTEGPRRKSVRRGGACPCTQKVLPEVYSKPARFTSGLTSSMMIVTMLSLSVISRCGSAASRSRSVEYWIWSAMQNSTGSDDFTNGSQNSFSAGGRDANQIAAEAPATKSSTNATLGLQSARTDRPVRAAEDCAAAGRMGVASPPPLSASTPFADNPVGRPGQEYCGA